MRLSDMRQLLAERKIQLTKSLGQNFLHDSNILQKIASAGEVTQADTVLEIGPGLGPLTELLLAQAGRVLAIEKDQRLVEFLQERYVSASNLELRHDDALEWLRQQQRDLSEWKVISNLPYSVASPILVELAQLPQPPSRIVATLQLEVARRLMAQPGTQDYGLLTLLVQLRYEPLAQFKIPASCFFPPPEVDSACVTLQRRREPLLAASEHRTFEKIVRRGFSQRRKMFFKLLKGDWPEPKLEATFAELALDRTIRAERVTLGQFVEMTRKLGGRG